MSESVLGTRVLVPIFELASCAKINLSVIKNHRYSNHVCPICEELVPDLLEHAIEIGDRLHGWLIIMES